MSLPPHRHLEDTFISDPPQSLRLEDGYRFRCGRTIAPFEIAYETFGELNEDRSNAVLVCHALSPSAHCAGKYDANDPKPGWWDGLVGYGKGIDLNDHFVICVNIPGSNYGTTAPATVDHESGLPWGARYPAVTIEDMVEVEKLVVASLGIDRLCSIAGGSLGGMQVLMWAAMYPHMTRSIIAMAAAAAVPVEGVAWHIIGRKIIESDPAYNGGDYYDRDETLRGLEVARMVGHMTYLSLESLERKFGRRRRHGTRQFEIDSYLEYQGNKFAKQFDANSYVRLQAAMDEMDMEEQYGSLQRAFRDYAGDSLIIAFETDWLFPPNEVVKVHDALRGGGRESRYINFDTPNGHDAFLVDYHLISDPVRRFLKNLSD